LIAELGWPTDGFISEPATPPEGVHDELARLNDLLAPTASAAEQQMLYLALELALQRRHGARRWLEDDSRGSQPAGRGAGRVP
jgi:hypothetical protein